VKKIGVASQRKKERKKASKQASKQGASTENPLSF